jgi:hypothetical protein
MRMILQNIIWTIKIKFLPATFPIRGRCCTSVYRGIHFHLITEERITISEKVLGTYSYLLPFTKHSFQCDAPPTMQSVFDVWNYLVPTTSTDREAFWKIDVCHSACLDAVKRAYVFLKRQ